MIRKDFLCQPNIGIAHYYLFSRSFNYTTTVSTLPSRDSGSDEAGYMTCWCTSATATAPTIGPIQYAALVLEVPADDRRPEESAGLMDALVSEPVASTHAPVTSPIASALSP